MSELVTNSVRHGSSGPDDKLDVLIERQPDQLRVEVCQQNPVGSLQLAADPIAREGGWGLLLVERLAQEWGVEPESNCVWFTLAA